jgi:hypothetical protein
MSPATTGRHIPTNETIIDPNMILPSIPSRMSVSRDLASPARGDLGNNNTTPCPAQLI